MSEARSRARVYALLGLMLLAWSANFIFVKVVVREIPPVLTFCFRTILSGVCMMPIYLLTRGRREAGTRAWTAADAPKLAAVGALGVVGNQLLFVVGLSRTSVAHGAVITALAPIFVLAGAAAMGVEPLTGRKLAGMATAVGGVRLLEAGRAQAGATVGGDLIMVASTMFLAAFTVFGKQLAANFGVIALNAFAFGGAAVLAAPATIAGVWKTDLSRVSAFAWVGVAYMALVSSIAGYLIYSYALRRLPASRVSSVTYFQPLAATLMAAAFLGENPGPTFAGATALVVGGVWVAERR